MSSAAGTRSAGHYRLTSTTSPRWPIDATWPSIPAVATATASPSQAARLGISLGPARKATGPAGICPHPQPKLPAGKNFSHVGFALAPPGDRVLPPGAPLHPMNGAGGRGDQEL